MKHCKWCDLEFKNNQALAGHCRVHHKNEWAIEKESRFKVINQLSDGTLSCPLCEFVGANLYRHLLYRHSSSKDDITEFKSNGYKLQTDNRDKGVDHRCKTCGKEYALANGLSIHMKYEHPDEFARKSRDNNPKGEGFICGCCGEQKRQIKQHIMESHNDITWEEYCAKFNHDPLRKMFMSESHKESLSKNKLKFFNETEEGREWRRLQSIKASENNMSKKADVKEKLARAMMNRFVNNEHENFTKLSYGTSIRFKFADKEFYVRSFEEFKIILTLLIHNKEFEYEAKRISYFHEGRQKTYLLDLHYDNEYLEIKSDNKYPKSKFDAIRETLKDNNKELIIINHKKFCERYNLPIYTGSYFCMKLNEMVEKGELISFSQITKSKDRSLILSHMTENVMNKFTKKHISDRRVMYEYCDI